MSPQSNEVPGSGASAVEQTIKPDYTLKISVDLGQQTTLLHWALMDLKQKFQEEAENYLASRSLTLFMEAKENMYQVNDLLDMLFMKLNEGYESLHDLHLNVDTKRWELSAQAEEATRKEELAKRFGWFEE